MAFVRSYLKGKNIYLAIFFPCELSLFKFKATLYLYGETDFQKYINIVDKQFLDFKILQNVVVFLSLWAKRC